MVEMVMVTWVVVDEEAEAERVARRGVDTWAGVVGGAAGVAARGAARVGVVTVAVVKMAARRVASRVVASTAVGVTVGAAVGGAVSAVGEARGPVELSSRERGALLRRYPARHILERRGPRSAVRRLQHARRWRLGRRWLP